MHFNNVSCVTNQNSSRSCSHCRCDLQGFEGFLPRLKMSVHFSVLQRVIDIHIRTAPACMRRKQPQNKSKTGQQTRRTIMLTQRPKAVGEQALPKLVQFPAFSYANPHFNTRRIELQGSFWSIVKARLTFLWLGHPKGRYQLFLQNTLQIFSCQRYVTLLVMATRSPLNAGPSKVAMEIIKRTDLIGWLSASRCDMEKLEWRMELDSRTVCCGL